MAVEINEIEPGEKRRNDLKLVVDIQKIIHRNIVPGYGYRKHRLLDDGDEVRDNIGIERGRGERGPS